MKGTDCTKEQIAHASQFLSDVGWPDDGRRGESSRDDMVRLIAWYGAVRFIGARNNPDGSLEVPGKFVARAPASGTR